MGLGQKESFFGGGRKGFLFVWGGAWRTGFGAGFGWNQDALGSKNTRTSGHLLKRRGGSLVVL